MTMKDFLKANRTEISDAVERATGTRPTNDKEREDWVLNDEGLYLWARAEGVPV